MTSAAAIARVLNSETLNDEDGDSFHIYVKDPSSQSYFGLMDRAFGKPVEQVSVKVDAADALVARLASARRRVA